MLRGRVGWKETEELFGVKEELWGRRRNREGRVGRKKRKKSCLVQRKSWGVGEGREKVELGGRRRGRVGGVGEGREKEELGGRWREGRVVWHRGRV